MKRRLQYMFGFGVALGLLTVTPLVFAHTEDTVSATASDQSTEAKADDAATIKSRVEKLKTDLKIKLTTVEEARFKERCKAAQGTVGALITRFGTGVIKRTKAYENLSHRLEDLIPKLKAANINTTELEQQKTELDAKIATYNTDLAAYKQALNDLKAFDCVTDPTGFKAALEAARTAHAALMTDATAIRSYVVDTIKPTLSEIRTQLQDKKSNGQEGTQ